MPIADFYLVRSKSYRFEVNVLQYFLHLIDVRMERTVGGYQSVGTEVRVVDDAYKAHVASECPDITVVFIFDGECLVYPVPNKAAL